MSSLVKYGSYDEDAAKAEQETLDRSGGGDFIKLRAGRNVLRFLPPPAGSKTPFVITHQHFVQFPGMTKATSFNCPEQMARRPCPVCAEVRRLRSTGNPADYELAGEYFARLRVYANVIDRDAPDLGPRPFAYGKTIHEALIKLREDGDFTNPEEGFDIVIHKKGEGLNTEYTVNPSRDDSPLDASVDVMNEWIESQMDVRMYATVPSAEDIAAKLGMGSRGASRRGGGAREALPAAGGRGGEAGAASPGRGARRSAQDDLDDDKS
jgi:hypothetical protein